MDPSGKTNSFINRKEVAKVTLVLMGLTLLYWPALKSLLGDLYTNNNNSHGLLVPFISLYLIWQRRTSLGMQPIQPSSIGLITFILCLGLYIIGSATQIEFLQRIVFVTSIIGVVLYLFGKLLFNEILFPLFFLYFIIPVPVSIESLVSFRLQLWVTQISSSILSGLSFAVMREGNMLYFANCSLEVAEACSGIRSLMAYIMLGCLFGNMMKGSYLRRFIMPFLAVPLAFLVNIARVTGTGVLAYYYGSGVARGFLHEFSGIAVFAVGLILYFCAYLIFDKELSSKQASREAV